ncbi:hypothetical protein [Lactococcus muris]|nr:hypothetical protein [Lactococcus muris]
MIYLRKAALSDIPSVMPIIAQVGRISCTNLFHIIFFQILWNQFRL